MNTCAGVHFHSNICLCIAACSVSKIFYHTDIQDKVKLIFHTVKCQYFYLDQTASLMDPLSVTSGHVISDIYGGAELDREREKLTGKMPNFGPWRSEQQSFHVPWRAAPPWSCRHSAESRGRTTALPCWPAFWHLQSQRKGWILLPRKMSVRNLYSFLPPNILT